MKNLIFGMTILASISSYAGTVVDTEKVIIETCSVLRTQNQRIFEDAINACNDPDLQLNSENFASGISSILRNLKNVKNYNDNERTLQIVRKLQQPLYDALEVVQGEAFNERFNH